jgi:ferredoxin
LEKNDENLLELAKDAGVNATSSFRSGMCHTCLAQVFEGMFNYGENRVFVPESDDEVLICSAVPTSDMVINI